MRKSVIGASLLLALAICVPLCAQSDTPRLTAVEPGSGTHGDVLTATGDNLDQNCVAALYLTDGKTDWKVVITEQATKSIKFKIPPEAKAGRFALMVLTPGKNPKLIEEPVKVTIEAPATPSTT